MKTTALVHWLLIGTLVISSTTMLEKELAEAGLKKDKLTDHLVKQPGIGTADIEDR